MEYETTDPKNAVIQLEAAPTCVIHMNNATNINWYMGVDHAYDHHDVFWLDYAGIVIAVYHRWQGRLAQWL